MHYHVSASRGKDVRDFAAKVVFDKPGTPAAGSLLADLYTVAVHGSVREKSALWGAVRDSAASARKRMKWPERKK